MTMFGGPKIKLDKDLLDRAEKVSKAAGYASVQEFVQHVLERELDKLDKGGADEDEIRKRMQGLGYIS
jgi:metal-responsive CopG/Arc/MetJ family transcriptional regulator